MPRASRKLTSCIHTHAHLPLKGGAWSGGFFSVILPEQMEVFNTLRSESNPSGMPDEGSEKAETTSRFRWRVEAWMESEPSSFVARSQMHWWLIHCPTYTFLVWRKKPESKRHKIHVELQASRPESIDFKVVPLRVLLIYLLPVYFWPYGGRARASKNYICHGMRVLCDINMQLRTWKLVYHTPRGALVWALSARSNFFRFSTAIALAGSSCKAVS